MNQDKLKLELISAAQTFAATFLTILGTLLIEQKPVAWTWALIGSLLLAAARAGAKAVWQSLMPVSLGGVKK